MPSAKGRCGAWCHGRRSTCRQWPVYGRKRCRWHGGLSTGPRTAAGRAAASARIAALNALHKALGKHYGGRRKGQYTRVQLAQLVRRGTLEDIQRLVDRWQKENEAHNDET
jgi:hypothetical protein